MTLTAKQVTADTAHMRRSFLVPVVFMWACGQSAAAQPVSAADAARAMQQLQLSHIQANVPEDAAFSRLLNRDLAAYFAAKGYRKPVTSFELLRRGATQSGVAYPKFYLWVRVRSADGRSIAGAVRVAAVDKQRFDVTDFLSAKEIAADPSRVGSVFPAPLVQAIIARARPA